MEPALTLTLTACGVFFLVAMLLGIWKHAAMMSSPSHLAPHYVDTAHRAALLYSFATLVLAKFVELSPFPSWVNVSAAALPLFFFAITIVRYSILGKSNHTDNQYTQPGDVKTMHVVMPILVAAEVGGFGVLFAGFLLRRFAGW
jgi:hypothetical protein